MSHIVKIKKMVLQAGAKAESAVAHHVGTKEIAFPETIATVADVKAAISAATKAPKGTEVSGVVLKLNGKVVEDAVAVTKAELKTMKVVFKLLCTSVEAPAAASVVEAAAPVVEAAPEAPAA
jgi:hypothetical protein